MTKFVQIWKCQWGTSDDIDRLKKSGTPLITAERLTADLAKAYDAGFETGKSRGRFEMRADIEHGRIEPIERLP